MADEAVNPSQMRSTTSLIRLVKEDAASMRTISIVVVSNWRKKSFKQPWKKQKVHWRRKRRRLHVLDRKLLPSEVTSTDVWLRRMKSSRAHGEIYVAD